MVVGGNGHPWKCTQQFFTFTIWGGMLPPSTKVSIAPNVQPHINQKVTEIF